MKYGFVEIEYPDGEAIDSVVMGNGSVRVTSILKNEEGFSGVAFSPAPDGKMPIGKDDFTNTGEPVTDMGIENQLLFDNPDSVDAVIKALTRAKAYLLDKCPQCGSLEGLKIPRDHMPYCEDCGWPDECRSEE